MNQINRIKKLIPELPEKDAELAYSFLGKREFRPLYELVNSCIARIARNSRKEKSNPLYENLDLEKLHTLEAEVGNYLSAIEPDWLEQSAKDSEEDEFVNEEY